jgi:hypothetical protein
MEKEIIRLIQEQGPLTGAEMRESISGDGLALWQYCVRSTDLAVRTVGTRYLRLDRRVSGFARLSPSIWRTFLTYSVIGLSEMKDELKERAGRVMAHIEEVSRWKLDVAFQTVSGLAAGLDSDTPLDEEACFIIGGDIVYNMAHDVPRPERSTGKLVNGSDMDIVVVVHDQCPEAFIKRLDDAIYKEKYRLLLTPHLREEIDYVVKPFARVREQVRFDSFRHMLACKILQEGTLLYGNEEIFQKVKGLLREEGVTERLAEMEERARAHRVDAEALLLDVAPGEIDHETLNLFYPSDESEEFE